MRRRERTVPPMVAARPSRPSAPTGHRAAAHRRLTDRAVALRARLAIVGTLVGAVALGGLVGTVALGAGPAGAGTIAADRAQASQLASEIAAESGRIDALAQRYDQAQTQEQQTEAALAQAHAQLAVAVADAAAARRQLRADALAAYMGDEGSTQVAALFQAGASGAAARAEYQQLSDVHLGSAIERYQQAQRHVAGVERQLRQEQQTEQATLASLAQTQQQAQAAVAAEQAQLDSVNANLQQQLLAQAHAIEVAKVEAQQAQAARQAAAQAAAARAAAAQAAAQAAASSAGPGGGSGPGGSDGAGAPSAMAPAAPAAPAAPVTASWQQQANVAVRAALSQVGTPYVWGGASPGGFDCSGLVMWAWGQAGVNLPHYSVAQYDAMAHVPESDLVPGDVVFYNSPYDGYLGHEALYIGNGQVVQAPMTGMDVQVTSLTWAGPPVAFGQPG